MIRIPPRYHDEFFEVAVNVSPVVVTSVGLRSAVAYRWKCNRCGKVIKPNTLGAQSHVVMHVRQAEAVK